MPLGRHAALLTALVAAFALIPLGVAFAAVVNTGRFVISESEAQDEDLYVASTSGRVDGIIDGDLIIASGSLDIAGTVTGDVLVAVRGRVAVSGTIEGSLRGVAREVVVDGTVADDVAVAATSVDVAGSVGRDLIGLGGSVELTGGVGRDLLGRYYALNVAGSVARDVDVTIARLSLGPGADVGGDVVYQANQDLTSEDGAAVGGQVIKLPTEVPFFAAVVLQIAYLLAFLAFLAGGIIVLWLFRATAARAVVAAASRPGLSLGVGAAMVVAGPVLLILLTLTLVGVPLAVALVLMMVVGLAFGTVPLFTAVGWRALDGRGGVFGGFVLGAVAWRLIAFAVPLLGAVVFAVAMVWGLGAWACGAWQVRSVRSG